MNTNSTTTLGPIKKIGHIIILAFISILLCFIILENQSGEKEYEDKLIINIFGKQRMYTQMFSKDTSRLYVLMEALEAEKKHQPVEDIHRKILEVKSSLRQAEQEFTNTYFAMARGYLYIDSYGVDVKKPMEKASEYIEGIGSLWPEFQKSIDILIQSDQINDDMADALIFINENNMELLDLCDRVQEVILKDSFASSRNFKYMFYILIGLLSAIAVLSLLHLLKFIILPFNRLYKGIAEIGLEYHEEKIHFPIKKRVTPMINEINEMFLKINNLISLIENMNNNSSFTESLNFINETFSSFIPYNYIGIALIDEDQEVFRASYGVSDGSITGLTEKIMGATWPMHDTSLGELIRSGEARIINDLEAYTANKPMKPYNQVILEAGIRASITLPMYVSEVPVGVIFFSSKQKEVYTKEHLNFLNTLVNSIAISLNQNIFINDLLFGSIFALAKLADVRDEDTGDHLERMKVYSRVIAELLYENNCYTNEITMEYIEKVEKFSPLHDIGKVAIRDDILLKPGKLTVEEFNEMKKHTVFGAEVLRATEQNNMSKRLKDLFSLGIEIAEGHHEKWDGSGYPYGKKELEIPLSARIVAVADVFDALTSKRPYKEPFSFDLSLLMMEEGRAKHFDPTIIDVFLANKERIRGIYNGFHVTEE